MIQSVKPGIQLNFIFNTWKSICEKNSEPIYWSESNTNYWVYIKVKWLILELVQLKEGRKGQRSLEREMQKKNLTLKMMACWSLIRDFCSFYCAKTQACCKLALFRAVVDERKGKGGFSSIFGCVRKEDRQDFALILISFSSSPKIKQNKIKRVITKGWKWPPTDPIDFPSF